MPTISEPGPPRTDENRIRLIAGSIYMDGFASGAQQAASQYEAEQATKRIGAEAERLLAGRLALVDKAIATYREMIRKRIKKLQDQGVRGAQLRAAIYDYARKLADAKSTIIAEMESSQGRLDGAGRIMDETGTSHEWRFAHFDLGAAHVECQLCKDIKAGNPYTQREAEAAGFPSYPHPGCDHGWVLVPQDEVTYTESNPSAEEQPRYTTRWRGGTKPGHWKNQGVQYTTRFRGKAAAISGGMQKAASTPVYGPGRFDTADDAIAWYNGWLKTLDAPDTMEGCPECSIEFGGWDPVIRWETKDGRPVYWYIVGTADQSSLVVEGEDTIRDWGNRYYHFYREIHGEEAAEKITAQAGLPREAVPQLRPSTPESQYWYDLLPDYPGKEREHDHAA